MSRDLGSVGGLGNLGDVNLGALGDRGSVNFGYIGDGGSLEGLRRIGRSAPGVGLIWEMDSFLMDNLPADSRRLTKWVNIPEINQYG